MSFIYGTDFTGLLQVSFLPLAEFERKVIQILLQIWLYIVQSVYGIDYSEKLSPVVVFLCFQCVVESVGI